MLIDIFPHWNTNIQVLCYTIVTEAIFKCKVKINFYFLSFFSGTRIKTRKRSIAAPLDTATFAVAVVQIYLDNAGDLVRIYL